MVAAIEMGLAAAMAAATAALTPMTGGLVPSVMIGHCV